MAIPQTKLETKSDTNQDLPPASGNSLPPLPNNPEVNDKPAPPPQESKGEGGGVELLSTKPEQGKKQSSIFWVILGVALLVIALIIGYIFYSLSNLGTGSTPTPTPTAIPTTITPTTTELPTVSPSPTIISDDGTKLVLMEQFSQVLRVQATWELQEMRGGNSGTEIIGYRLVDENAETLFSYMLFDQDLMTSFCNNGQISVETINIHGADRSYQICFVSNNFNGALVVVDDRMFSVEDDSNLVKDAIMTLQDQPSV